MTFRIEKIPNSDNLYMRVHIDSLKLRHRNYQLTDRVPPNIFVEHKGSMSTEWDKYAKPEDTRSRDRADPQKNGVIGMNVGEVRSIPPLEVKHSPKKGNRSHTDVIGVEQEDPGLKTEIRTQLSRVSEWRLRPLE